MYFGHAISGLKDNVFQVSNKELPANLYFYIALLYDYNTHSRYLKIGTAKRLSQRYDLKSPIARNYRLYGNYNYTYVRILSAVSVEKDKAYSMENEAREVIKKMKGFVYIFLMIDFAISFCHKLSSCRRMNLHLCLIRMNMERNIKSMGDLRKISHQY